MTTDSPRTDAPAPTLPRDTLEFAAGLVLGIAAGIGLGLALGDEDVRRSLDRARPRGRSRTWTDRVARRLGRG